MFVMAILTIAKAAAVGEQPEGDEVSVAFFLEDAGEAGLDVGRAHEAGVVAQDAQGVAVAEDAPLGGVTRVEVCLHRGVWQAAAALRGEAGVATVEIHRGWHQQ